MERLHCLMMFYRYLLVCFFHYVMCFFQFVMCIFCYVMCFSHYVMCIRYYIMCTFHLFKDSLYTARWRVFRLECIFKRLASLAALWHVSGISRTTGNLHKALPMSKKLQLFRSLAEIPESLRWIIWGYMQKCRGKLCSEEEKK